MSGLAFTFSLGSVIALSIANDICEYRMSLYLYWALIISIPERRAIISFKITSQNEKLFYSRDPKRFFYCNVSG